MIITGDHIDTRGVVVETNVDDEECPLITRGRPLEGVRELYFCFAPTISFSVGVVSIVILWYWVVTVRDGHVDTWM